MPNALTNAGFLDSTVGWGPDAAFNPGSTAAVAVDTSVRGTDGRAVLRLTGTASESGQKLGLVSGVIGSVAQGDTLEAYAGAWATGGASEVSVAVFDGSGVLLERTPLPLITLGNGKTPSRGLPRYFDQYRGLVTIQNTGFARMESTVTSFSAGAIEADLYKPYLAQAQADCSPSLWDPGPSTNVDLQGIPVWPGPPLLEDNYQPKPTPLRKGFATDSAIPMTRKLSNSPFWTVKGRMLVTEDQEDALQAFFEGLGDQEKFWFVMPHTDQLCWASFMEDGDPTMSQVAADRRYLDIGLLLQVA